MLLQYFLICQNANEKANRVAGFGNSPYEWTPAIYANKVCPKIQNSCNYITWCSHPKRPCDFYCLPCNALKWIRFLQNVQLNIGLLCQILLETFSKLKKIRLESLFLQRWLCLRRGRSRGAQFSVRDRTRPRTGSDQTGSVLFGPVFDPGFCWIQSLVRSQVGPVGPVDRMDGPNLSNIFLFFCSDGGTTGRPWRVLPASQKSGILP